MNRSTVIVLMLGLICSATLFAYHLQRETVFRNQLFAAKANQNINHIANGMGQALHAPLIVSQAFGTLGALTSEQFDAFASPLMARYPYLVGMGYRRLAGDAGQKQLGAGLRAR